MAIQIHILSIIKRVFGLFYRTVSAIPKLIWNTVQQTGEVKKSADLIKDAKQTGLLYFYGDHFMYVEGKFTKDMKYISPKNLNRLYRVRKIYKNFSTPERLVIVDNDNPESLDFENPPSMDEFPKYVNKIIKDGAKNIKTSVDMETFKIKGGETLNSIAYDIYRHNILQFLSTPEKSELIYIILAVSAIMAFFGFFGGTLFGVFISYIV